jgi:hypothetical protein
MLGRRGNGDLFLLQDGRALVVGGSTPEPTFTDVEIYDPASGVWASTPTSPPGRVPSAAMVVQLTDDRVLVAGGTTCDSSSCELAIAKIFDPPAGTWSATASMPAACIYCRGTLLSDGGVLAIGGYQHDRYTIGLLYDPLAARWSSTAPPAQSQAIRALTLLGNGRVLAVHDDPGLPELYDPASGSWTATSGRLSVPGEICSVTLLEDGRVLVTVADFYSERPSWAEIYDPRLGSWSAAGTMTEQRLSHSAALLADGRVLVAGGSNSSGEMTSAEIFDPAAIP